MPFGPLVKKFLNIIFYYPLRFPDPVLSCDGVGDTAVGFAIGATKELRFDAGLPPTVAGDCATGGFGIGWPLLLVLFWELPADMTT